MTGLPRMGLALASITIATTALAAGLPAPSGDEDYLFEKKDHFSPYAGRNFPTQVFWGDTHLHTQLSMDAGAFGVRLMPEDAYDFARGEELRSSTGLQVKLSQPLDFLVVSDHSDNMGFFTQLFAGDPTYLADPTGKRWYEMIQEGGQAGVSAAVEIIEAFSNNEFPPALASVPGSPVYEQTWEYIIDAAEAANDPGVFTAFIGYEWTSNASGDNRHRVVIYRDGGDKASMALPAVTLPPQGSPDPRELWKWMAAYEQRSGGRVLAIPHNGNLSNGVMFPMSDTFTNRRFDRAWAETRALREPIYEATQIKGDGEAHPVLSPDDEFADFENWDQGNLDLSVPKENAMLPGEYARSGLLRGLELEERLGVNPYKFGMIGATDSHTGLATAEEENFFGKHSGTEPSPERVNHPMATTANGRYESWDMMAGGLAGVWARENTREALFDAMMRREVYATTGPRMLVRFFGGWEFTADDTRSRLPADAGYSKGVPMGADLPPMAAAARAPTFLVAALRDPYSGNLDRIQIVKGWLDGRGQSQEKVYDVVWGDASTRTIGSDGRLAPVGSTVNVADATWTNTIGDPELIGVWQDPDFDPDARAFYYARVLEIPTPRWTAYEVQRFGVEFPEGVEMTLQERAYTSPIWYAP